MPPTGSDSIFISYRREDSAGYAGRLCEHLTHEFGGRRVFMDVADISPGQDFSEAIDGTLASCRVVLPLIGPHWLSVLAARPAGEDFVRHEIGAALARGATVIPVLVGGASMPHARDLPAPLAALAGRQAIELRESRFDDDLKVLVAALHQHLPAPRAQRRLLRGLLGAALAAVVGSGIFWFMPAREPPVAGPRASANLGGVWLAQMQANGQPPYPVRFEFAPDTGANVIGTVSYPTGEGAIRDGVLDGARITFSTSYVARFESEPAVSRWAGELVNGELHLVLSQDSGTAQGVARRRP